MGRERPGSDIDLSLQGPRLRHQDLLQLMEQVDELLLAWKVDLSYGINYRQSWRLTCSELASLYSKDPAQIPLELLGHAGTTGQQ